MFVTTTLSMERMQITECLSAPLDILLMAKVTVLQPEVRHNTVFAQATPCLQSSAEVNAIRHRSLTSTNSHFKRGHVVVEYSNPIEFPPQNRYWLPHDLLLPLTSVNDNLSDAFPASKKCKSCIDTDGIVTCLNAQLNRNTFFFSEKNAASANQLSLVYRPSPATYPWGYFRKGVWVRVSVFTLRDRVRLDWYNWVKARLVGVGKLLEWYDCVRDRQSDNQPHRYDHHTHTHTHTHTHMLIESKMLVSQPTILQAKSLTKAFRGTVQLSSPIQSQP